MFKNTAIILLLLTLTTSNALGEAYMPISQQELVNLTATEAAEKIASGDITSVQLVEALIKRTRANKHLNAYISFNKRKALRAAYYSDWVLQHRGPIGPLHGVPIVLKDNIDAQGFKTTAGTLGLAKNKHRTDAPVTQALRDAGAIIIGKTNMHELAFGITSDNAAFGTTRNPYNPLTIPGGSSGGTAVAVSARMAPAGLGTDTGASIRLPAALTGIVGFRPTVGRFSQEGIVPISNTRDTAGPIARTVEDIILLDGVMSNGVTQLKPANLSTITLGVPRGYFFDELDPDVRKATDDLLKTLENQGVRLIEADIPNIAELNNAVSFTLVFHEVLRQLPEYLKTTKASISLDDIVNNIASPDVQGAFAFALGPDGMVGTNDDAISDNAYSEAINTGRPALQKAYIDYFETYGVDAIIFPTSILPARLIEGSLETVELNGEQVPTFGTYIKNTDPGSNAGIPGLSIPIGLTPSGLPLGIEIDSLANTDQKLLEIGLAIESIVDQIPAPILSK